MFGKFVAPDWNCFERSGIVQMKAMVMRQHLIKCGLSYEHSVSSTCEEKTAHFPLPQCARLLAQGWERRIRPQAKVTA